MMDISPVYRMKLLEKVETEIWSRFKSYVKVEQYIKMNQEVYDGFGHAGFDIYYFTDGNKKDKINLAKTLENIAIDIPDKFTAFSSTKDTVSSDTFEANVIG